MEHLSVIEVKQEPDGCNNNFKFNNPTNELLTAGRSIPTCLYDRVPEKKCVDYYSSGSLQAVCVDNCNTKGKDGVTITSLFSGKYRQHVDEDHTFVQQPCNNYGKNEKGKITWKAPNIHGGFFAKECRRVSQQVATCAGMNTGRIRLPRRMKHCDKCAFRTAYMEGLIAHYRYKHAELRIAPAKKLRKSSVEQKQMVPIDYCISSALYKIFKEPDDYMSPSNMNKNENPPNWKPSYQTSMAYKCEVCGYATNSKRSITHHNKICNIAGNNHTIDSASKHSCDQCDYTTSTKGVLQIHLKRKHPVLLPCEYCGYKPKSVQEFRAHLLEHKASGFVSGGRSVPELFSCSNCSYIADNKVSLSSHRQAVHSHSLYICDKCNYHTKYRWTFRRHQRKTKHANCNTDLSSFRHHFSDRKTLERILSVPNVRMKSRQEPNGASLICDKCGYVGKCRASVLKHLRQSHTSIACDKCAYIAESKRDLTRHTRQTHPESIAVNAGENSGPRRRKIAGKHQCHICGYTSTKSKLAVHQTVHEDTACPECGEVFMNKAHLMKHRRLQHGQKRFRSAKGKAVIAKYPCRLCTFKTRYEPVLRHHLLEVHQNGVDFSLWKRNYKNSVFVGK